MNGKVVLRTNFNDCLNYVLGKPDTEIIGYHYLKQDDKLPLNEYIQQLDKQFQHIAKRSKRIEKPCIHLSLSPHPDDYHLLDNQKKIEFTHKLLNQLGYQDCQWLLTEHHDTITPEGKPRPHLHVIINRIPINNNKAVNSSLLKRKTEETLQKLREEFGLRPVPDSHTVERKAPTTGEIRYYRRQIRQYQQGLSETSPELPAIMQIQNIIDQTLDIISINLSHFDSASELFQCFQEQLEQQNIKVKINNNNQVKYSLKNSKFEYSGSRLGKKYGFKNIINILKQKIPSEILLTNPTATENLSYSTSSMFNFNQIDYQYKKEIEM